MGPQDIEPIINFLCRTQISHLLHSSGRDSVHDQITDWVEILAGGATKTQKIESSNRNGISSV